MRSRSCVDRASCLDSSVRSATRRRTTTTADHTPGDPTTLLPAPTRRLTALPATDCGSCSASARGVRSSRTATTVRGPRPPDLRVPEAAFPASRPVTLSRPLWDNCSAADPGIPATGSVGRCNLVQPTPPTHGSRASGHRRSAMLAEWCQLPSRSNPMRSSKSAPSSVWTGLCPEHGIGSCWIWGVPRRRSRTPVL